MATDTPVQSDPTAGDTREEWLRDFYKECGREATLAYTTLNQMKNWAILIVGAVIPAVVALGKTPSLGGRAIVAGAAVSYLFTLRFFVRAILCYLNLLRWNKIQSTIVRAKLLPESRPEAAASAREIQSVIQTYYVDWGAVIDRKDQIVQNLRLGFALLFTFSLFFLIWGAIASWTDPVVRALVVFTVLTTVQESLSFRSAGYFDTPAVSAGRKRKRSVFPIPAGATRFIGFWLLNLAVSLAVASWPWARHPASVPSPKPTTPTVSLSPRRPTPVPASILSAGPSTPSVSHPLRAATPIPRPPLHP